MLLHVGISGQYSCLRIFKHVNWSPSIREYAILHRPLLDYNIRRFYEYKSENLIRVQASYARNRELTSTSLHEIMHSRFKMVKQCCTFKYKQRNSPDDGDMRIRDIVWCKAL